MSDKDNKSKDKLYASPEEMHAIRKRHGTEELSAEQTIPTAIELYHKTFLMCKPNRSTYDGIKSNSLHFHKSMSLKGQL